MEKRPEDCEAMGEQIDDPMGSPLLAILSAVLVLIIVSLAATALWVNL